MSHAQEEYVSDDDYDAERGREGFQETSELFTGLALGTALVAPHLPGIVAGAGAVVAGHHIHQKWDHAWDWVGRKAKDTHGYIEKGGKDIAEMGNAHVRNFNSAFKNNQIKLPGHENKRWWDKGH